jgi:hypothetical protein
MCWYNWLYHVFISCVLVQLIVSCLHQLCVGTIDCIMSSSVVCWYNWLYYVFISCVLVQLIVSCLHQLCVGTIDCIMSSSVVCWYNWLYHVFISCVICITTWRYASNSGSVCTTDLTMIQTVISIKYIYNMYLFSFWLYDTLLACNSFYNWFPMWHSLLILHLTLFH